MRSRWGWLLVVVTLAGATGCGSARPRRPAYLPTGENVAPLYHANRVDVVGMFREALITANGCSDPRLEMTADFVSWRDITPRQLTDQSPIACGGLFESAQFLTPSLGWVTFWNVASDHDYLYRTADGGKTWSLELTGEHAVHGGAQGFADFLSATDGFAGFVDPAGPTDSLFRTRDGGRRWRQIGDARSAPALPIVFVSRGVGYAGGSGLGNEYNGGWGFEVARTDDGGLTWRSQQPALPTSDTPASDISATPLYQRPTFTGSERGVLPVLLPGPQDRGAVAFYASNDRGARWGLAATVTVNLALVRGADDRDALLTGPLAAVAGPRTWWVVDSESSDGRHGYRIRITADAGRRWRTIRAGLPPGTASVQAFSATRAWALVSVVEDGRSVSRTLLSTDAGRLWAPLAP